jgi:hypothetical protein
MRQVAMTRDRLIGLKPSDHLNALNESHGAFAAVVVAWLSRSGLSNGPDRPVSLMPPIMAPSMPPIEIIGFGKSGFSAARVRHSLMPILLVVLAICGSCMERKHFAGRTLRIGFDNAPPYSVIAPDGTPGGLAVELIAEAARRQQINLHWVDLTAIAPTGFDIDGMLSHNMIDLWPVVGIAKARLARIYIARPWLENSFFLVSRKAAPVVSSAGAKGKRVIHVQGPLAIEMANRFFGGSQLVPVAVSLRFLARSARARRTRRLWKPEPLKRYFWTGRTNALGCRFRYRPFRMRSRTPELAPAARLRLKPKF